MLPNSGITTTMVANELGKSTHNVGALCSNRDINIYSKYKPIHYALPGGLDDIKYAAYSYGWILPDKASMANQMEGWVSSPGSYGWYVNAPKGGSASPYRLGDFRKYDHHAIGPLFTMDTDTEITQRSERLSLGIRTSSVLQLTDFVNLEPGTDTYYGICIMKDGSTTGKYTTLDNSGSIIIDKTQFTKYFPSYGTYKIYAYVTKQRGQGYDSKGTDYIAPNVYFAWRLPIDPVTVTYSYKEPEILFNTSIDYVMLVFDTKPYKLTYEIKVVNKKAYRQFFQSKDLRVDYSYGTAGYSVSNANIKFFAGDIEANDRIYIQTEVPTEISNYYDLKKERIPIGIDLYYKDEDGKVISTYEYRQDWGWENGLPPKD